MSVYRSRRRHGRLPRGWRRARYLSGLSAVASLVSAAAILLRAPVGYWWAGVGAAMLCAALALVCAYTDQHAEAAEAPLPPSLASRPAHGQYYHDSLPTGRLGDHR